MLCLEVKEGWEEELHGPASGLRVRASSYFKSPSRDDKSLFRGIGGVAVASPSSAGISARKPGACHEQSPVSWFSYHGCCRIVMMSPVGW